MVMGLRSVSIWGAALFLALMGVTPAAANSKYAAYVVHADSGDVLFDRYSTGTRYPASLTKMMTLYLLFDELEAEIGPFPVPLLEGDASTEFGLDEWPARDIETLRESIIEAEIPHLWQGRTLLVAQDAEDVVDDFVRYQKLDVPFAVLLEISGQESDQYWDGFVNG